MHFKVFSSWEWRRNESCGAAAGLTSGVGEQIKPFLPRRKPWELGFCFVWIWFFFPLCNTTLYLESIWNPLISVDPWELSGSRSLCRAADKKLKSGDVHKNCESSCNWKHPGGSTFRKAIGICVNWRKAAPLNPGIKWAGSLTEVRFLYTSCF